MSHSAMLTLVGEGADRHVVVTEADDELWISYELIQEALKPDYEPPAGGLEIAGDLVTFGTPGEGLGRFTYRITGYMDDRLYAVAEREARE